MRQRPQHSRELVVLARRLVGDKIAGEGDKVSFEVASSAKRTKQVRRADARTHVNVGDLEQRTPLERLWQILEGHRAAHELHPVRLDLPGVDPEAGCTGERGAAEREELSSTQHEFQVMFAAMSMSWT
jgi:hypothetical protein